MRHLSTGRIGLVIMAAVVIPFTGYVSLIANHDSRQPMWLWAAIPFALIGPDFPSLVAFVALAFCNVLLWATITFALATMLTTRFTRGAG